MFAPSRIRVGTRAVALACALATSSISAHAVLERVGPVSMVPSGGGFPSWYQDTTGIAMEFCSPTTQSEADGGWCLLLAPDVPAIPEVFPTNFFDEHFYWSGSAVIGTRQLGGKALLVLAEEGAFALNVVPGDQITFSRIRVRLQPIPVSGSYRFIHPYGEEVIEGVAGDRIFFSDDAGVVQGIFTGALNSRMGPWLLPSATPGGPEMPALTAQNPEPDTDPAHFGGVFAPTPYPGTGASYIADPARLGPVTGSSLPNFIDSTGASRNHNIFRIEGPAGSGLGVDPLTGGLVDWLETTDFNLMGRLHTGVMPGLVGNARASYTRNATGKKLDVFAIGDPATTSRLPAHPAAAKIVPTVTFFDAPCAGTDDSSDIVKGPYGAPLGATETQMFGSGNVYWGQARPAVLPSSVCVKNGNARDVNGIIVPVFFSQTVTDEVTVTQAHYDATAGSLTVKATSSDATVPPVLSLAYGTVLAKLVGGEVVVPNVLVPPASVLVQSAAKGVSEYAVSTTYPGAVGPTAPVATPDSFTFAEDSGAHLLAILANDLNAVGGSVTITSAPSFGTAVLNLNGSVTYTPSLNANGVDSFTYTVTVGAQVSGTGNVLINLTPVNDPPVAVNDAVSTSVNVPVQINVIANDTDPDGNADVVAAVNVSASSPAGATITATGGIVSFVAATAGTYTFTYRAQDSAGISSANTGRVTVTVTAAQSVSFTSNKYTVTNRTLRMVGTIVPVPGGNVNVMFVLTDAAGLVLGPVPFVNGPTGTLTVVGGKFDVTSAAFTLPAGATRIKATTAAGVSTTTVLVIK